MNHQSPLPSRPSHRTVGTGPASAYQESPCKHLTCRCSARPERRYCSDSCAALGARHGAAGAPCRCDHELCTETGRDR
jgi:hypothetical protein